MKQMTRLQFLALFFGLFLVGAHTATAAPFNAAVYCRSSFKSQFFYVLFPDGTIRAGLPKGGLETFDFARDRTENPAICGTYVRQGDQYTFTYGDKAPYTWKYARNARGEESMNGAMWIKEYPFAPGQRIEGSYQGGGSIGVGTGSSIITTSECTFRADGTFSRANAAVTQGSSSTSGASAQASGTYALSGYTMTVTTPAGTSRHTVSYHFQPTDPAQPSMFVLDGSIMTRK